jgi:hypothetical protein
MTPITPICSFIVFSILLRDSSQASCANAFQPLLRPVVETDPFAGQDPKLIGVIGVIGGLFFEAATRLIAQRSPDDRHDQEKSP